MNPRDGHFGTPCDNLLAPVQAKAQVGQVELWEGENGYVVELVEGSTRVVVEGSANPVATCS